MSEQNKKPPKFTVTRVKQTEYKEVYRAYYVGYGGGFVDVVAKDELDAFVAAQTKIEDEYMTGRNVLLCGTIVVLTLISAFTYGAMNSSASRDAAFAACIKANRQFSVNDAGFYSCK